jgi:aminotransferase
MHISERELELPETILEKLSEVASENKEVINLGLGEPDFLTPKPVLDYAKKIINKSTHYTSHKGRIELREALAKKLSKENKINVNEDNIVVTTGSQQGLFAALLAVFDPSEEIILSNPGYLGYIPAIELINAVPRYVKLNDENNFNINPDEIKKAINKGKTEAILINSPNNPTGNVLSKKILEEISDIAVENDLYIFSDEAYEKLVYDKKHISIGSLNGMKDYILSFFTFSKTYAMCGFRLGYCVLPDKLVKPVVKTSQYMNLCAPNISQLLGIKALSLKNSYINKMISEYNRRRKFIVNRLNNLNLKTNMPDGAFYAFANIKNVTKKTSLEFSNEILKKCKVAVIPGIEFGKYGEGYLRFSYANNLDLIKKALEKIERII